MRLSLAQHHVLSVFPHSPTMQMDHTNSAVANGVTVGDRGNMQLKSRWARKQLATAHPIETLPQAPSWPPETFETIIQTGHAPAPLSMAQDEPIATVDANVALASANGPPSACPSDQKPVKEETDGEQQEAVRSKIAPDMLAPCRRSTRKRMSTIANDNAQKVSDGS